jgi:hypothetical protein
MSMRSSREICGSFRTYPTSDLTELLPKLMLASSICNITSFIGSAINKQIRSNNLPSLRFRNEFSVREVLHEFYAIG